MRCFYHNIEDKNQTDCFDMHPISYGGAYFYEKGQKKLTGVKKVYAKVKAVNAYGKESVASSVKNVTVKK